jgi:RNA polymerase sigma-70 factor (ECF subfamily)
MEKSALGVLPMEQHGGIDVIAETRPVTFDEILAFRETVFRICLGFSRDYAVAEDLAQDVYVRAFRDLRNLRNPVQAREWLFRIAKNTCLDRLKGDRRRGALLQRWAQETRPDEDRGEDGAAEDLSARLKTAVRGLPKKLREAFVLQAYGQLTYEEISATLRIPRGTVMSRLNRARARVARITEEKRT